MNNVRKNYRLPVCSPVLSQLFLAAFATVVFCGSAIAAEEKAAPAPKAQGLPVEVVTVAATGAVEQLEAVGTIQADESITVVAEVAGKVEEVLFTEGAAVKRGAVLLRLDPAVLAAERDRAAARVALSEANERRSESLLKDQAISVRERDEALAQLQLDEAAVRLADAQLEKMTLRAPFAGVLGLRQVSVGGYLQPGIPVVTLDAIDTLKVEFRVPEARAAALRIGKKVFIAVDAVSGEEFVGEVYAITPRVDIDGRSIALRARVPNPDHKLLPGMFARIRLIINERPAVLFVPEEALIPAADRLLVYKVVEGKVEAVTVTTGQRRKGEVEIVSGLQVGDTIITAGHIKVRPGMPVTALPAPGQGE